MALVIVSEAISTPATFTLALRVTSPTLETTPFTGTLNEPSPSFAMVNSIPQKWGKPWQSAGGKFPNIILKPNSSSIR